jgi:hypothetical protein
MDSGELAIVCWSAFFCCFPELLRRQQVDRQLDREIMGIAELGACKPQLRKTTALFAGFNCRLFFKVFFGAEAMRGCWMRDVASNFAHLPASKARTDLWQLPASNAMHI